MSRSLNPSDHLTTTRMISRQSIRQLARSGRPALDSVAFLLTIPARQQMSGFLYLPITLTWIISTVSTKGNGALPPRMVRQSLSSVGSNLISMYILKYACSLYPDSQNGNEKNGTRALLRRFLRRPALAFPPPGQGDSRRVQQVRPQVPSQTLPTP